MKSEALIKKVAHSLAYDNPKRKFNYLLIFSLAMVPVITLTSLGYVISVRSYNALTAARYQAAAIPISNGVGDLLRQLEYQAADFAAHPTVRNAVNANDWGKAIETLSIFKNVRDNILISRLFITDKEGNELAAYPELTGGVGKNFSARDWYKGVVSTGEHYVSEAYLRTADPRKNVIAIATPITDHEERLKGILVFQVTLEDIGKWVKENKESNKITVYLVDRKGHIVFHPSVDPNGEIVDFSQVEPVKKIMDKEEGALIYYEPLLKKDVLAAYKSTDVHNFGVVVEEPVETAFALIYQVLLLQTLINIAGIFISAFFIYLLLESVKHYQSHW